MEPIRSHRSEVMPNLSIKNVPPDIVERLHARASSNHRSLQGELMALVTAAVTGGDAPAPPVSAGARPSGHKSIEQIAAEHLARVKRPMRKGGRAADLIRAERDGR